MAKYEHLPIFKAMMDLAIEVERAVQHFPRSHKYALGAELRALCHQGLGLIAEANSSPVAGRASQSSHSPAALGNEGKRETEGRGAGAGIPGKAPGERPRYSGEETPGITYRASFLLQLRLTLERLKIHLLLAKEVQAFNRARTFYRITELTVAVSRQNEGWLKSMAG